MVDLLQDKEFYCLAELNSEFVILIGLILFIFLFSSAAQEI
jgi:hypothetical protein